MKKIITHIAILAGLLGAGTMPGYSEDRPNRVIFVDKAGGYNSYVTDDIGQLQFIYVPGEVSVAVRILEDVQVDYMVLEMLRSEACQSFNLAIAPRSIADKLTNQAAIINYVESEGSTRYYNDFTYGEVTGIDLHYSTPYSILTVAYDEYGIAAGVTVTNFVTPDADIVGYPDIEVSVLNVDTTSFTLRFEPNEYVGEYYLCSFEGGTLEEQFEMFGAFMGYANLNDFIKGLAWDQAQIGPVSKQWDNMDPGTTYDIAMAITDKNGNFIPYPKTYSVSTVGFGGTGESYVTVTPGEYVLADWDGQMLPSQFFTFTPNDQTARYRFDVWTAADYDTDPEGHNQSVQQEAPPAYGDWWYYEEVSGDFQMNPSTSFVIVAASQNANHEWGKLNVYRFTTPAAVSNTRSEVKKSQKIAAPAKAENMAPNAKHFVTKTGKTKKITLTNKQ